VYHKSQIETLTAFSTGVYNDLLLLMSIEHPGAPLLLGVSNAEIEEEGD
jgi:hypothetical protein